MGETGEEKRSKTLTPTRQTSDKLFCGHSPPPKFIWSAFPCGFNPAPGDSPSSSAPLTRWVPHLFWAPSSRAWDPEETSPGFCVEPCSAGGECGH